MSKEVKKEKPGDTAKRCFVDNDAKKVYLEFEKNSYVIEFKELTIKI